VRSLKLLGLGGTAVAESEGGLLELRMETTKLQCSASVNMHNMLPCLGVFCRLFTCVRVRVRLSNCWIYVRSSLVHLYDLHNQSFFVHFSLRRLLRHC